MDELELVLGLLMTESQRAVLSVYWRQYLTAKDRRTALAFYFLELEQVMRQEMVGREYRPEIERDNFRRAFGIKNG